MRFVIDEKSWCFDGLGQDDLIERLETLLDLLDDANEQGHLVCYSEDLFSIYVWQNKSFYDLYEQSSPFPIPWEVRERVASIFSRLPKWQELDLTWSPAFEVHIDQGSEEYAPSVAWAHEQTKNNKAHAVACLVFPSIRSVDTVLKVNFIPSKMKIRYRNLRA